MEHIIPVNEFFRVDEKDIALDKLYKDLKNVLDSNGTLLNGIRKRDDIVYIEYFEDEMYKNYRGHAHVTKLKVFVSKSWNKKVTILYNNDWDWQTEGGSKKGNTIVDKGNAGKIISSSPKAMRIVNILYELSNKYGVSHKTDNYMS